MTDFNALKTTLESWLKNDPTAASLWSRIDSGSATYDDATKYSRIIGRKWSELLQNTAAVDVAEEEITSVVNDGLRQGYRSSAYYTKRVQEIVNKKAGISMKSFEPAIDDTRLSNLLTKLQEGVELGGLINDKTEWLVGEDVIENITRSAVTDTIEYNARKQSEAGINAYIIRDAGAGCCSWCNSIAGVYEYGDQPSDFFRVHKGCTCTITYKPSKSKMQRISFETNDKGKLTRKIVDI